MDWKTALYEYVHYRNQMEIDYTVEPLRELVDDPAFLHRSQSRLTRTALTGADRDLVPMKNETRLRLLGAWEHEQSVEVDIALKRTIESKVYGQPISELRVEKERLLLVRRDDRWRVARVTETDTEPLAPPEEDIDSRLIEYGPEKSEQPVVQMPSVPYLNTRIVSPLQPAYHRYNRMRAVQYADTWWYVSNPQYVELESDCTNFLSQCLFAGGLPMHYTGKRDSGWWYKGATEHWSFSWTVSNVLQHYLTANRYATVVESAGQLTLGDMIVYDWDGDGRWTHSTIVTAKDPAGMPLVNAHTISSKNRFWDYKDSPSWTTDTRYKFLHMADEV